MNGESVNENVTLLVTRSLSSGLPSICSMWVEGAGSLFTSEFASAPPFGSTGTLPVPEDQHFFCIAPDGFWSSADNGD